MSIKFSTIIQLGAKAPFYLIIQLSKSERSAFIEQVTPNMHTAFKQSVMEA